MISIIPNETLEDTKKRILMKIIERSGLKMAISAMNRTEVTMESKIALIMKTKLPVKKSHILANDERIDVYAPEYQQMVIRFM